MKKSNLCDCEILIFRPQFWCEKCRNFDEKKVKLYQSYIYYPFSYIFPIYLSHSLSPLIYDVGLFFSLKTIKNQRIKGFSLIKNKKKVCEVSDKNLSKPDYLESEIDICIPNKIKTELKYVPSVLKKKISKNLKEADELCLLFLSLLNSTSFHKTGFSIDRNWKPLKVEYLRKIFNSSSQLYSSILKVVQYPLKNGSIIEKNKQYTPKVTSFKYRFSERFLNVGMQKYKMNTPKGKLYCTRYKRRVWEEAVDDLICKNLILFYSQVTLPSEEEIYKKGKELEKQNYMTRKGKRLVCLQKRKAELFPTDQYAHVETGIKIFRYLFNSPVHRFKIPRIGSMRSGGRIIDSIVLVPSWIRKHLKVNGRKAVELDYTCLHPNIAVHIYRGTQRFLTHQKVANELGCDEKIIKTEHLSFFNKSIDQMKKSPLYRYYSDREPEMLERIMKEKQSSEFKYKITSRKLFSYEVQIMTAVIKELNALGIYVGYVYDALICEESKVSIVRNKMNTVIQRMGVYTGVK